MDFLETHCLDCHDAEAKKGGVDLSSLGENVSGEVPFALWVKVHDAVSGGEMPPKDKRQPSVEARRAFVAELDRELIRVDRARIASQGRAIFRRLTRSEYENAVKDLLALSELHLASMLPSDGTRHGFDKVGEALDLSHVQLANYLEAADRALDAAIATRPDPPPLVKRRIYPTESFKFHMNLKLGSAILLKDGQPDPFWPVPTQKGDLADLGKMESPDFGKLKQSVALLTPNLEGWRKSLIFAPMHAGRYRLRLSTWSFLWNAGTIEAAPVSQCAKLHTGPRTLGYFEAPSLSPRVYELSPWLEMGDEIIFDPASFFWTGLQTHQRKPGAEYVGPATVVDWLEVEGPLQERWPPESHRRLFGDLPIEPFDPSTGLTPPPRIKPVQVLGYGWPKPQDLPVADRDPGLFSVKSDRPLADAKRLLAPFLERAFRRPVPEEEVDRYVGLVAGRLEKRDCFELAMRHACKAALTSPHFLYRQERPGELDDQALATRLAFWLHNSTPDLDLMKVAGEKRLREPGVLRAQVDRMLDDPRSERFVRDFLDQWLNLRNLDATDPDAALYPEFHLYLKESMLAESRAFFRELIAKDLPAANIVASDFAMLNQRLAEHYGIPGISGPDMRRVNLPEESHRGGFLTQAAVLKVTANGTVSSPVVRGAFVTERILGQPVPPPPAGIPAIDPDTRGATTIREQLARHRTDASCAACHLKMDPPGFALESYDVIGGYRQQYRSLAGGAPVHFRFPDGTGVRYRQGPVVDCAGETAQGRVFAGFAGLQEILLEDPEKIARSFVEQLLPYATGAEVRYADRREIDRILQEARASRYGIRTLMHGVAQSTMFRTK
ncbi:MAG: Protein of unknown function DUF1592/DUF1588/DUF1587/DUF1585/DUF1595/Planctomycete cytochrome C [Verrucomicrobia bacterium]|nr:MAG: Protein of unknown function DUF1592/DUF1588/DUF1587/DUF1585/DUF1595/Planctomycete cytochrome C [Verrucomicrobiota bacterium]